MVSAQVFPIESFRFSDRDIFSRSFRSGLPVSRRFYLPPRRTETPPKVESDLWTRLRLGFTLVGVLAVTLLVWWYFTDQERWDSSSSARLDYLGSTTRDNSESAPLSTDPTPSPPAAVLKSTQTDSPAVTRQPLIEHPVRLEVWNACGEKGLAQRATAALRMRGTYFDVRGMGNAMSGNQDFTSIIGRTADSALALAIADSLGVAHTRVTTEIPKNPRDIDVTLILGADYPRLQLGLKTGTKE
jgi:hypothetical protein